MPVERQMLALLVLKDISLLTEIARPQLFGERHADAYGSLNVEDYLGRQARGACFVVRWIARDSKSLKRCTETVECDAKLISDGC